MKVLIVIFLFFKIGCSLHAQTLDLSELLRLGNMPPADINTYLTSKGWQANSNDTLMGIDDKTMLEHNMKWAYKEQNDTSVKLKFFYKKKQNKSSKVLSYYENTQYTMACKACFNELRDSVLATGWGKTQDERSDKQVMQTFDAGDFSIMLFSHFKKEGEYYDVVVFRKRPVE